MAVRFSLWIRAAAGNAKEQRGPTRRHGQPACDEGDFRQGAASGTRSTPRKAPTMMPFSATSFGEVRGWSQRPGKQEDENLQVEGGNHRRTSCPSRAAGASTGWPAGHAAGRARPVCAPARRANAEYLRGLHADAGADREEHDADQEERARQAPGQERLVGRHPAMENAGPPGEGHRHADVAAVRGPPRRSAGTYSTASRTSAAVLTANADALQDAECHQQDRSLDPDDGSASEAGRSAPSRTPMISSVWINICLRPMQFSEVAEDQAADRPRQESDREGPESRELRLRAVKHPLKKSLSKTSPAAVP